MQNLKTLKSVYTLKTGVKMRIVNIVLFLLSVGIVLGPICAVVIANSNDLTQLILPPEIKDILLGNYSPINGGGNGLGEIGGLTPEFVSQTIDISQRNFTNTVNFKNDFNFDLELNSFDAGIQDSAGRILGNISLSDPISLAAGESIPVEILGEWTEQAESIIGQASSVDVKLVDLTIDINGVTIQLPELDEDINIPLTR